MRVDELRHLRLGEAFALFELCIDGTDDEDTDPAGEGWSAMSPGLAAVLDLPDPLLGMPQMPPGLVRYRANRDTDPHLNYHTHVGHPLSAGNLRAAGIRPMIPRPIDNFDDPENDR